MRKILGVLVLLPIALAVVLAHHGWGSYDASKTVAVQGPIETSSYTNPHATITVKAADKVWTVTLAPRAKVAAALSLALWIAVAACGRSIAYF